MAVQVATIKPTLKAPGIKLLELKYYKPLSNFAFKINLCRYTLGTAGVDALRQRGRGLHSFTSQLNLSAFNGIGCARRGCVARVKGVVLGGV